MGSDRGRENVRWAGLTLLGEAEVPVWVHGWAGSFQGRVGQTPHPLLPRPLCRTQPFIHSTCTD